MKTLMGPKGSPDPLHELATFLLPFALLFRRASSHRGLSRYVMGLLSDLPRKNCETIAQAVANTSLEHLQHLLTDASSSPWALEEQRVRSLRMVGDEVTLATANPKLYVKVSLHTAFQCMVI